jgi:hypothetical protein
VVDFINRSGTLKAILNNIGISRIHTNSDGDLIVDREFNIEEEHKVA